MPPALPLDRLRRKGDKEPTTFASNNGRARVDALHDAADHIKKKKEEKEKMLKAMSLGMRF